MHASKAYQIHVRIYYLIRMEGIALILSKMNALGTSEMLVLSAGKVNTLLVPYIPSHTSYIFSLILL